MIDNILFACDFSASSKQALAYGLDLVERTGATLHFMHVHEVSMGPFVGGEPSPEAGQQKLQAQFRERCNEALGEYAHPPDDAHLSYIIERSGAVAPALMTYAEEHGVDLIVMGTHGRRGVKRVLFGSVAEEVLRSASCPVLTARTEEEEEHGSAPASVERLVVPIDFSDASRSALQYAVRLANIYDAPLTLVHVVELPKIPTVYEVEFSDLSPEEIAAQVRTELEEWGRSVAGEGVDISTVVESGDPVPTLLDRASTPNDLLVMATHGLSGVKRRVLGSIAEGVLRRAPGPVITGRTFPES
jgi:nucleotide-binding universal stress UspA family protein